MIIVRSPLRISFAGGGTDLREYYSKGWGAVCSMAINKYIYVTVNNLSDYFPHRFRVAYSQTELVQEASDIKHPIVRECLTSMNIKGGLDVNVMSDIPAGTGMGSSSTFTVGLLHALAAFQNRLMGKEALAEQASHLEIEVLREPIGKQDQYAAAFGGLHLFKFLKNGHVSADRLPVSRVFERHLVDRLLLFYLGGQRSASAILRSQASQTEANRVELDEMRDQAVRMSEVFTQADVSGNVGALDEIGAILHRGWLLKKKLASGISNSDVDCTMQKALDAGALGGKLLGAGGTGFVLFYVRPEQKADVRAAMGDYAEVAFDVDPQGSTLLYYGN